MILIRLWITLAIASASIAAQPVELLVLEKLSSQLGFYTAAGKRLAGVLVGEHPHELILSADGRYAYTTNNGKVWMTDPGEGGNTISIVDVQARKKTGEINLGNFRRPHGIDLDPRTGRLVVTTENPDRLLLIDPAKRSIIRDFDTKGKSPHMVALGPRYEWAYVSNTESATIAAIHLESGETKLIPSGKRPQGGTLSKNGKLLYIVNSASGSITVIDTDRRSAVRTILVGNGPGRVGLTADGKGLIYNLGEDQAVGFARGRANRQRSPGRVGLSGVGQTDSGHSSGDKTALADSFPRRQIGLCRRTRDRHRFRHLRRRKKNRSQVQNTESSRPRSGTANQPWRLAKKSPSCQAKQQRSLQ